MNNKKKCFVIMPFSQTYKLSKDQWTEIFEDKIKTAVEESGLGYKCERYEFRRANITKEILQELNNAHVVIADLTSSNPNVLWELGVRHTLSRRAIPIAQDNKFLPSDLKDYPIVTYKYKQTPREVNEFKQEIQNKLKDIESDPDKPDSPVAEFLTGKNKDILAYEKSANWKKIDALLSELSKNLDHMDIVLEEATNNQKLRKKKLKEEEIKFSVVRFDTTCLDLLNSTHYLSLPENVIRLSLKVREFLKIGNTRLDCWSTASADDIEKLFVEFLPSFKSDIISLTKDISTIRMADINDNYMEPGIPPPIFKRPEHQEYIKSS